MEPATKERIIFSSIFVMLLICLLFFFPSNLSMHNPREKVSEQTLLASQILTISALEDPNADPDSDGIPNWQENIMGTDPHEKNVFTASSTALSAEEKKRLSDPNNMTVALTKNNLAVASYSRTLASSTDIDYDGLSSDVLQTTLAAFSFKTYTESDIKVTQKVTQTVRKGYGNTIALKTAAALHAYFLIDEKTALKDLIDGKKDTDVVKNLQKKVAGVKEYRSFLLTTPVPKDAVTYHLDYLNAVERYYETLAAFENVEDDPVKAALLLRGYKDIVQGQFTYLSAFETYFSNNNLVFSPKDAGYVFTVGIQK